MEKDNNVIEINLSDFWKVLKRCWWLLLAVVILVSGLAYLYMDTTHSDRYQSTATLYVIHTGTRTQYSDASFASQIIPDCEKLILSEDNVIIPAIGMLTDTEYSDAQLQSLVASVKKMVRVYSGGNDSFLIYITVTSKSAANASKLANTMASAAYDYLNGLYGQNMVNIVDSAKTPNGISNPISLIKVGLVGLAAAVLVYLIWLIVFLFDDRIDSEEKVEKRLGLTVLGSIPYRGSANRRRKNRYGSYNGYYGYGKGIEQQKAQEALSSGQGRKEERK